MRYILCLLLFIASSKINSVSLLNENSLESLQELQHYINEFPQSNYEIFSVPQQGKFFVEPHLNDVIKNVLRSGNQWEPHILKTLSQYIKPGTVVLDIGAHIGTFTIAMANTVGSNGVVYAFEPQRKIYRELIKNLELNHLSNVSCFRIAIGDEHKLIQMDRETYANSEGSTSIGSGGDFAQMRTLDSFNFTNVSLVKIDVERTEEQVLDGMVQTIENNRPVIIIELQGGYIWETAPDHIRERMLSSVRKLEALGYTVSRIHLHDYLALPNKK